MRRDIINNQNGFTLVEILTTIAIIAILLGFLIPALSMIEKSAVKVKQRAQFHGIEVALEAFSTDMGDYPPSEWYPAVYGNYTASQRLAEAIIGQDGLGFHPASRFRGDGLADMDGDGTIDDIVYHATTDETYETAQQNLAARKGPYLELENANAVKLSNLYYGSINYGSLANTYVLADMYKITKNLATGKMVGSPILYYKANRGKIQHDLSFAKIAPTPNECTYNVWDSIGSMGSQGIAYLKPLSTKTDSHPLKNDQALFYQQSKNPNFPGDPTYPASGNPPRPYRSESFLLQSAGPDSLYGTADDVFNFDSGE